MAEILRYATGTTIVLPLRKASDGRLAGSGDYTHAAGDVTVSTGAAFGTASGTPAYTNGRWTLALSAAELTGATILVKVADLDGPAVQDELFEVRTYGHASAFYPDNYAAQNFPAALVGGRMDSAPDAATVRGAVGLTSANLDTQLDALPTAAENAAGLLDLADAIEAGLTPRAALRLALSILAGKLAGAQTGTETFRNAVADTKNRVVVTDDEQGNRTAITYDLS